MNLMKPVSTTRQNMHDSIHFQKFIRPLARDTKVVVRGGQECRLNQLRATNAAIFDLPRLGGVRNQLTSEQQTHPIASKA